MDAADGGHVHGNFPRYYEFHKLEDREPSVRAAAASCFAADGAAAAATEPTPAPFLIADLGCNSGELTALVQREFAAAAAAGGRGRAVRALGLELDSALVDRAYAAYPPRTGCEFLTGDLGASLAAPGGGGAAASPARRPEAFGALRAWLAAKHPQRPSPRRFDVVCGFGLTMWLHLHHGDAGLAAILRSAASVADALLLEPQPWPCYRKAYQRLRKRRAGGAAPATVLPHYEALRDAYSGGAVEERKVETFIERVLKEEGFVPRLLESSTAWDRTIVLYTREAEEAAGGDEAEKKGAETAADAGAAVETGM